MTNPALNHARIEQAMLVVVDVQGKLARLLK